MHVFESKLGRAWKEEKPDQRLNSQVINPCMLKRERERRAKKHEKQKSASGVFKCFLIVSIEVGVGTLTTQNILNTLFRI